MNRKISIVKDRLEFLRPLLVLAPTGVRKIKKGCHAEALEACALGIANYVLAFMHGVKASARMLRVPQHDTHQIFVEEN